MTDESTGSDRTSFPDLDELAARCADPERSPGVGAICASALRLAASLVQGAARASGEAWNGAPGAAAQAESLGLRAVELAGENAANYSEALEALRAALEGRGDPPDRLAEALDAAAATPRQIAELAADVGALAALAAAEARPELRPEASGAAQLAASAAETAAGLVRVNLATMPGDERLAEAEAHAHRARESARAALDAIERL